MTLVNMDKYEEDAIFSCTPLFVLLEKKRAKIIPCGQTQFYNIAMDFPNRIFSHFTVSPIHPTAKSP